MKKSLILLTLCSFLTHLNATELKNSSQTLIIKVVEGRKVLTDSIEGKEIEAKLGNLRAKFENDIKKIDTELEKEVTELRSKARVITDPEILEKEQERILRKKKERDSKAETSQEEFNRTAQRDLAKFNAKLQETVIQNAKKLNWDIVSLKETGEIIYVSDKANGTTEITKALDSKRKEEKAEHTKKLAAPVQSAAA